MGFEVIFFFLLLGFFYTTLVDYFDHFDYSVIFVIFGIFVILFRLCACMMLYISFG